MTDAPPVAIVAGDAPPPAMNPPFAAVVVVVAVAPVPVANAVPPIVPVHMAPYGQQAACPTASMAHAAVVVQQNPGAPTALHAVWPLIQAARLMSS